MQLGRKNTWTRIEAVTWYPYTCEEAEEDGLEMKFSRSPWQRKKQEEGRGGGVEGRGRGEEGRRGEGRNLEPRCLGKEEMISRSHQKSQ